MLLLEAAPLNVAFTDITAGTPTAWKWSFGDNTYSTVRNPVHTYNKTGKYTVSLTVWNDAGSNTAIKSSYIVVATAPAQSTSPAVNETQITTNVSMKEFPAIYGDQDSVAGLPQWIPGKCKLGYLYV